MNQFNAWFAAVSAGDVNAVTRMLDEQPALSHARQVNRDEKGAVHGGSHYPTSLQVAAEHGALGVVKLLIDRGAEIYESAQWGYPAIAHAHWKEQAEIVAYFLHEAASHPSMRGSPTYGLGCDVNLAARNGWTERVAQHVAKDRLAVHRRGVIGETPLHWAGHNGHLDVVRELLKGGADVNADEIGLYGGKPLHWAAEHQPAVVELLLKHGADVNGRNVLPGAGYEGFTPLIWLASQKEDCIQAAKLLMDAGADIHATDVRGRTAVWWARERGAKRVETMLRELGVAGT